MATQIAAEEARDRGCWRFSSYFLQAKELDRERAAEASVSAPGTVAGCREPCGL
jgi:hypothetical protein